MSDKIITLLDKAYDQYVQLRVADSQRRAMSKVLLNAPPKKQPKIRKVLTDINTKVFNLRQAYDRSMSRLLPRELDELIERINKNYD